MPTERTIRALIQFSIDKSATDRTRKGVKGIEDALDDVEDKAKKAGKKVGDGLEQAKKGAAGLSGALGAAGVAGAVAALTAKFAELATAAIAKLKALANEAVELNSNLEQAQVTFANVFGSNEAADKFINFLKVTSTQLGINTDDAIGFAKSLVPDTESQDQFNNLLRVGVTLARDQKKSMEDVRFAFEEAITGDFVSLKERLGVPKESIERIKELSEEIGLVPALVQVLDERFKKTGVTLETFSDTYETAVSRLESRLQDLKVAFGDPIFDQRKESARELSAILEENTEDYTLMAGRVGDLVAAVEDFINSGINEFLQNLDNDQVLELLDTVYELLETGRLLADIFLSSADAADDFNNVMENAGHKISLITDTIVKLVDIFRIAKATIAGFNATMTPAIEGLKFLTGQITFEELEENIKGPIDAFKESMASTEGAYDAYLARLKEDTERQRERRDALNESAGAMDTWVDSTDDGAEALDEYNKALAKVNEAQEKLNTQFQRAELEALIDAERAKLKALEDFAQKRIDNARKAAQQIADIERRNQQAIEDTGRDLSRQEQDIARDNARQTAALALEGAKEKESIETDHQRRIRDIRQQFEASAEEALRSQDAIGFLRAQRQRDEQLKDAQQDRQDRLADSAKSQEEKRAALQLQQQQEIEDARIANERKLEDLQIQLDRELEAHRISQEREAQELAIAEERKNQELATAQQQRTEDLKRADEQRKADLEASLAAELEIIRAYEAQKTEAQVSAAQDRARQLAQIEAQNASAPIGTPNNPTFLVPTRDAGGYIGKGVFANRGDREYVLNAETTKTLEKAFGGKLTQEGILAGLGGGDKSQSISFTQQNTFNERDDVKLIAKGLAKQMDQKLLEYSRGFR